MIKCPEKTQEKKHLYEKNCEMMQAHKLRREKKKRVQMTNLFRNEK